MSEYKYYCQAEGCNNEIPTPQMCCSAHDCGCMGLPIEPPVCSEECFYKAYPHMKRQPEQEAKP